eukprot:Skav202107  [mRNA]  locus=scaffold1980:85180:88531:+ [translate_table: standard]
MDVSAQLQEPCFAFALNLEDSNTGTSKSVRISDEQDEHVAIEPAYPSNESDVLNEFPLVSKHVIVLSWGKPEIKFGSKPKLDDKDAQAITVDPKKWSPIAAEFHMRRSNCSRLAKLRESLHETNLKMAGPWQKALMKPSATLADFMKDSCGRREVGREREREKKREKKRRERERENRNA